MLDLDCPSPSNPLESSWEDVTDSLLSPHMKSLVGPVRILDAQLQCVRQAEGVYHHVYTLRTEMKDNEKTEADSSLSWSSYHSEQPKQREVVFRLQEQKLAVRFDEKTSLKEVLRYFHGKMKGELVSGVRMALLIEGEDKSVPVKASMAEKKLIELGKGKLTIVADNIFQ